jgi:L-ribulose-5-phosphate 3-epimerase
VDRGSRRNFLKSSVTAAACAAGLGGEFARSFSTAPEAAAQNATATRLPTTLQITKGLVYGMLPGGLSHADRFKMARDTGFEVVQAPTTPDQNTAEEIKNAADKANIRIDSVMNMDHWDYPLSSSDPVVVERSLAGMRTSLHNARLWGSDAVLLVPAVVNPQTSYRDAWTRSQTQIRKLIPLAAELRIVIAIEEVWNRFLLSPLEMDKYIREFQSPWVRAWFDVGNVLLNGYPQDWIRTLGENTVKLHVKDFKREKDGYAWVNLGDGDADWAEVRKALAEIGYSGSAIAELDGGDAAYLHDVSRRMDRLVLGRV